MDVSAGLFHALSPVADAPALKTPAPKPKPGVATDIPVSNKKWTVPDPPTEVSVAPAVTGEVMVNLLASTTDKTEYIVVSDTTFIVPLAIAAVDVKNK